MKNIEKNLFFYLKKIILQEAETMNMGEQKVLDPVQIQQNQAVLRASDPSRNFINQKYRTLLNKADTKSLRDFLNSIDDNQDNLYKTMINRLQSKRDPETPEDKILDEKMEQLLKNPDLKNSFLKLAKMNSNLSLDELKTKFINDDIKNKKIIFKQIMDDIDRFKTMPTYLQNKTLDDGYKRIEADEMVEDIVNDFLKSEIKNEILNSQNMEKQQSLLQKQTIQIKQINQPLQANQQPTSPQEKIVQQLQK